MDRHILITGQGRSGSTLFYSMMQHCLRGFHLPDREVRASDMIPVPGNTCTKRPFDVFDFDRIAREAEDRKRLDMIVMLRDPRDILTSIHRKVPDDYFLSADYCYFLFGENGPTRTMPGLLMTHFRILEILKSGVFPQGVFLLKYEHLVEDPDRIQAKLAAGLDLTFEGRFSEFYTREVAPANEAAMNGVRPVARDRVAKWQRPEHRDRIIDQFTRFPVLHDILIDLGYETSTDWFDRFVKAGQGRVAEASRAPLRRES